MSKSYEYDPEYGSGNYNPNNCGEVHLPPGIAPVEVVPTNEYTGSEYELLGEGTPDDASYNKSIAKDTGVDLNGGAAAVTADYQAAKDEQGADLNDTHSERMDAALENFRADRWRDLSLDEQKQSMTDLANYVAADTGNKNPPEIVFRNDMKDGSYGGYNPSTNTIEINQNMLDDSTEAADTIAHEMWHAYQHQCAADPTSEKGREYQEGFDNYISPEYDFEGYQNQMVEAEAREYAQGYKDRIAGKRGYV